MENPLISVLTPFYNVVPYLEEAIESVLHQTYSNWELLLVDDGSTDGSREIALKYVKLFPEKIKYLQHPKGINKGLPASRNLAVQMASGEFLALLDADDYWLDNKLTHQVSIAKKHPEVSMICGASMYWYSWADKQKDDVVIPVGGPQDMALLPPTAALSLYPLGKGAAPCPCSIMIKKETAIHYHGFEEQFRGKYQLYEDQAFFVKIYLHELVYISSAALDRYRQRPDSIMTQSLQRNDYLEVRRFYLQWLQKYLNDEGINDPAILKKVKKALFPYKKPVLYKIKQLLHLS